MKVVIAYSVPVDVEIDTDTGEILSVIQGAREIERSDLVYDEDGFEVEDAETLKRALLIATTTDWPAWQRP